LGWEEIQIEDLKMWGFYRESEIDPTDSDFVRLNGFVDRGESLYYRVSENLKNPEFIPLPSQ